MLPPITAMRRRGAQDDLRRVRCRTGFDDELRKTKVPGKWGLRAEGLGVPAGEGFSMISVRRGAIIFALRVSTSGRTERGRQADCPRSPNKAIRRRGVPPVDIQT
jgi:hypothetical protein